MYHMYSYHRRCYKERLAIFIANYLILFVHITVNLSQILTTVGWRNPLCSTVSPFHLLPMMVSEGQVLQPVVSTVHLTLNKMKHCRPQVSQMQFVHCCSFSSSGIELYSVMHNNEFILCSNISQVRSMTLCIYYPYSAHLFQIFVSHT